MHARRIVNKFDCNEHVNCAVKKRKAKGAEQARGKGWGGERGQGVSCMCLQFFVHCAAFSFFVITRAFSAFVALLYSSLLVFLLIFSCTFCCAFRTLRIRRVCVCAAETRQLTKRVLFCSCLCSLSRSLFVELCVCTAVSPSFALTPPPPPPFFTPPTCIGGRPLRLLLQPPMLDTRVSRVFIMPRTRVQGDGGGGTHVAEPVAVHCPGCNAVCCCFCAAHCVFSVLFLSCFGTLPLTMAA